MALEVNRLWFLSPNHGFTALQCYFWRNGERCAKEVSTTSGVKSDMIVCSYACSQMEEVLGFISVPEHINVVTQGLHASPLDMTV